MMNKSMVTSVLFTLLTTTSFADSPALPNQSPKTLTKPTGPLDCNYKIPKDIALIEKTLVLQWAEKAAQQSFDFNSSKIDQQLLDLKPCFTEQGWQSFNDALQKSGNLTTIKSQNLNVTSKITGASTIKENKGNQWAITIPIQVTYQNDKDQLTQPLNVELLIGRKVSGDLGIMQIIASPVETKNAPK